MSVAFCPAPSEEPRVYELAFCFPFMLTWICSRAYICFMCNSSLRVSQLSNGNSNWSPVFRIEPIFNAATLSTMNITPWKTALQSALKRWRPEQPLKRVCSMCMSTIISLSFGILSQFLEWCMLRAGERWFFWLTVKDFRAVAKFFFICTRMQAMEMVVLSWSFRSQPFQAGTTPGSTIGWGTTC